MPCVCCDNSRQHGTHVISTQHELMLPKMFPISIYTLICSLEGVERFAFSVWNAIAVVVSFAVLHKIVDDPHTCMKCPKLNFNCIFCISLISHPFSLLWHSLDTTHRRVWSSICHVSRLFTVPELASSANWPWTGRVDRISPIKFMNSRRIARRSVCKMWTNSSQCHVRTFRSKCRI